MPYKKKLIEVAIPLEAINVASAREKSIRHGHPSTLHLWWARRPLAACRAVLFAQLVDDPSGHPHLFPTHDAQDMERKRLFAIIEDLVKWENSNNEVVLERARAEIRKSCGGVPPSIYDPFSGGASIPLEAQRLGLDACGSDLNPVAVMIGKAMIEIPPRYKDRQPIHPGIKDRNHYRHCEGLAEDVKYYGDWMRERAWERIGHLYPQVGLPSAYGGGSGTVVAWIWARTVPSPDPAFANVMVPLVRSFQLSDNAWVEPVVTGKEYEFKVRTGDIANSSGLDGTVGRQGGRCIVSNSAMPLPYIRDMGRKGQLGQRLMAVAVEGSRGRIFISPTKEMEDLAFSSKPSWLPEELVTTPSHEVDRLPMYGMTTWGAAFTDRQAVALTTFVDIARELKKKIAEDLSKSNQELDFDYLSYSNAIRIYLSCAIDRCADAWSTIATWATGGFIRFTFARQAIAMTWDFAECNVFSSSTGNFSGAVDWVVKALSELPATGSGSVTQADARFVSLPNGACLSTDPPYYDNIGYADLSDYFYVWLKRSVGDIYPEVFSTIVVPKTDELVAMPHRHKNRRDAENYFLEGMSKSFLNITSQLDSNYPATIYYAFKQRAGVYGLGDVS